MVDEKFFLYSRTIIGAIVVVLVQLAPILGISFGQEDANLINEQVDAILTSVGALLTAWGLRDSNGEKLTLKP